MALTKSQKVFNLIRIKASNEYKNVVPSIDESTPIGNISTPVLEQPLVLKEFTTLLGAVLYEIALRGVWSNPLAKHFLSDGSPLGEVTGDVAFGMVEPRKYDPLHPERLLFNAHTDDYVSYYVRNIKEFFKMTIIYEDIKGAFSSYGQFDAYIDEKLASLTSSAEWSQYNHMIETIVVNYNAGVFKTSSIKIPKTPDRNFFENWTEEILTITDNMTYPSSDYNNYGMLEGANGDFVGWSKSNDIVILAQNRFIFGNRVRYLASAFNLSEAEVKTRIITVPNFDFIKVAYNDKGDPIKSDKVTSNIGAVVIDRRGLVCKGDLYIDDSFYNPETLSTNFFKHRWYTMSVNPKANAIVFEFEEGEPTLTNAYIEDYGNADGENFIDIKVANETQTMTVNTIPSDIPITSVTATLNSKVSGSVDVTNDTLAEYLTFAVTDGKIVVTGLTNESLESSTILVDLTLNDTVKVTTIAIIYAKERASID